MMIDQILSDQLSKQLIKDLDFSIALNESFVSSLKYEIRLLKLDCLTLFWTGYSGTLFWMGGGAKKPPNLTLNRNKIMKRNLA